MFLFDRAWVSESRRSGYEVSTTTTYIRFNVRGPVYWRKRSERLTTRKRIFPQEYHLRAFARSCSAFSVAKCQTRTGA